MSNTIYCCEDCEYTLSSRDWDNGKGRIMFNDLKDGKFRCGVCDVRVSDPQGMFPNDEEEEVEILCGGCGKNDIRNYYKIPLPEDRCSDCEEEEVEEEICPSCGDQWTEATRCDCPERWLKEEEEEEDTMSITIDCTDCRRNQVEVDKVEWEKLNAVVGMGPRPYAHCTDCSYKHKILSRDGYQTLAYKPFEVGSYNIFITKGNPSISIQNHFILKITKVTDKFVTYILRDDLSPLSWFGKECRRKIKQHRDQYELKYPPSWGSDYNHWIIKNSDCFTINS